MNSNDLQCPICFEFFDGGAVLPRILTVCGHTVCDTCLRNYTKNHLVLQCPVCKKSLGSNNCNDLPINYALKNIAQSRRQIQENDDKSSAIVGTLLKQCVEHNQEKEFRCDTCEEWICSKCGMTDHKQCDTRLAPDAMEDVLHGLVSQVNSILNAFKNVSDITGSEKVKNKIQEDIEQKESLIKNMASLISVELSRIEELKSEIHKTTDDNKLTLEIVELLHISSLKLTATPHISFSEFITLESDIETRIQILFDAMANNRVSPQAEQTTSIDEVQQFKSKMLMLSMHNDKKAIVQCASYSSSVPLLLAVEIKDSKFSVSSFIHYHHKEPEIKVTENALMSLSKQMSFQLSSGDHTELGEIQILKNFHDDPLFYHCLGLIGDTLGKIKMTWSYDGWLSSSVLQIPVIKLPEELRCPENRIWSAGEVALTISSKKKRGTNFRILFCHNSRTQFEHSRIVLGKIVKGQEVLKDAFDRSRRGELIKIDKMAIIGDI